MATMQQNIEHSLSKVSRGLIIRGVVGVAFGILLAAWPGIGFNTLVLVVGAFAFADGIVSIYTAFMPAASGQRGWLVFQGILGIAIGVVTYVSPNITAFALLYVVGAWAILLGITQLVVAFRFPMERSTKVMLVLYGVVCIAFGVLMYARPGNGALALVALIAAFAMVTGATLVALGVLVRREGREAVTGLFPTSDPTTPDASHEVKAS